MTAQAPEDTMTEMDELLPCPFCGGAAAAQESYGRHYVVCLTVNCYCAVGERYDRDAMPDHVFNSKDDAIAAWNTRATPARAEGQPLAWDDPPTAEERELAEWLETSDGKLATAKGQPLKAKCPACGGSGVNLRTQNGYCDTCRGMGGIEQPDRLAALEADYVTMKTALKRIAKPMKNSSPSGLRQSIAVDALSRLTPAPAEGQPILGSANTTNFVAQPGHLAALEAVAAELPALMARLVIEHHTSTAEGAASWKSCRICGASMPASLWPHHLPSCEAQAVTAALSRLTPTQENSNEDQR